MSSATAPYPYFNGITYNPSFFSSSSSSTGLTQAQANLLYLRKTTADTATATETFSKILLTEADTPTPTVDFNLLSSETGNINLGINVPATKTIKIGPSTGTSVQCGSISFSSSSINNAVASDTGNLSIASNQTTGILNIGTSSGRTGTGTINIGNNSANAFDISIGSATTNTTLNGIYVQATTKLQTPKIDSLTADGNIEIGNNQTTGLINKYTQKLESDNIYGQINVNENYSPKIHHKINKHSQG